MHTWALFSCSSLVTLTAYNLAQLPKAQVSGPEPEPDPSSKFVNDAKFSLEALSQAYPEFEPAVALPPLPDTPQMSQLDTLSGYDPAFDAAQYSVKEVDLLAMLGQENLSFPTPDKVVTYRAEAVQPLPSAIPAPLPTRNPLAEAIAAMPEPVATPQPEQPAAAPTFARTSQPSSATQVSQSPASAPITQVPTRPPSTPQSAPAISSTPAAAVPSDSAATMVPYESEPSSGQWTEISNSDSSELFAALPETNAPSFDEANQPQPSQNLMADQALADLPEPLAESPDSTVSMELMLARRQLVERYCARSRKEAKPTNKLAVCADETNELAQSIPDAATAGTPIPGKVESPTRSNPETGVLQFGNSPLSAAIAGP